MILKSSHFIFVSKISLCC